MPVVYLSVGSNKEDRLSNIKELIEQIKKTESLKIISVSSLYETEPVGFKKQKKFYNMCMKAETNLNPYELLSLLKNMEKNQGRKNSAKWGPRIIDADILYFDNLILKDKKLEIPHPEIHNRKFVLIPLEEVEPDFIDPRSQKKIKCMIKDTENNTSVKKLNIKIG